MPNTFPFYDAEPYWPKRNSGSGGGSGSGGSIGETLPYYYYVTPTNSVLFFLSTSPFTDMSGKTYEQLEDMSISSVISSRSIEVYVSDGLYFCCMFVTEHDIDFLKSASSPEIGDYEWGAYSLGNDNIVYVTGPTNANIPNPEEMSFIMISDLSLS